MDMNTLNGFEVFDGLMPGAIAQQKKTENTDTNLEDFASEELTDDELDDIKKQNKQDTEEVEEPEEEQVVETKSKKKVKQVVEEPEETGSDDSDTDTDNNTDDQSVIVGGFFDTLAEQFGWDDVEEDEKPKSAEELVQYFKDVIEENSKPEYASEEVEALDKYVRNGGNLKDYFAIDNNIDLENIDLEEESNQKIVLREFLKEKGFSASSIDKKLSKYEDAGILEDEAEDALEALKDIKTKKKEQLLAYQEKSAREAENRQRAYFNSVVDEIKGLDSIRGIKIPEKDKRVLLEYIFKPTSDGMTKFQKDWSRSVKNLIESAYFTMKGDLLVKAAEVKGQNEAINKFKNSLNRTGVSKKTKVQENTSTESMWDSFARRLRV